MPVYVRPLAAGGDTAALIDRVAEQIVENDQRRALTEAQRLNGIQQLLDAGVTPTKVAQKLAVKKNFIKDVQVVSTSGAARAAVETGQLSLTEAAALAEFIVMWTLSHDVAVKAARPVSVTRFIHRSPVIPNLTPLARSPLVSVSPSWCGDMVKVCADRADGVVRSVRLLDGADAPVEAVCRYLEYVQETGGSPNTALAYAYDLRYLFDFLNERQLDWTEFGPSVAFDLLSWLRRRPLRHSAPRSGRPMIQSTERVLAPSTVARALAAVSSFYEWAVATERFAGENPLQRRRDLALIRVAERHQPFAGAASRQLPTRRAVRVRVPSRLPRPMRDADINALLESISTARDLAIVLLMLDGGLRPGEVLGLHLEDIEYGRRRVTIRKRDDHPRGARQKSHLERVVDLLEARTLDAVNRYVMHERPPEANTVFVFVVGGRSGRRTQPLSYTALVRMFSRRLDKLNIRTADTTPHALRHTHATAMWEAGMRELSLQQRLGHASPESTRIYTRVTDAQVRAEYDAALRFEK